MWTEYMNMMDGTFVIKLRCMVKMKGLGKCN